MGKAAEIALAALTDGTEERIAALRDRLEEGLLAAIDECGVNGAGQPRTPNTSSFYFDHLEGEALVIALDLKGIAVSGGSACSSGSSEASHVLNAMGVLLARARASLRFSLSRLSTGADVDYALETVPSAVARLRELSPLYRKPLAQAAN
jgi:cysteine desulfurase